MTELEFIMKTLAELVPYVREQYENRSTISIKTKTSAIDLVTDVDIAVQRRFCEKLAAAFPNDVVMAEELGMNRPPENPNTRCWILDPIDGTTNFVRGLFPLFGISAAFVENGVAAAGGVALPITGDVFLAERGSGAFHNGKRIAVSNVASLEAARVEIDFSSGASRSRTVDGVKEVLLRAGHVRGHSSAVVGLCSVATGDMDAYLHFSLNPWDFAASQLIIEEAGGTVTQWNGKPVSVMSRRTTIAASNRLVHEEVLCLLKNIE